VDKFYFEQKEYSQFQHASSCKLSSYQHFDGLGRVDSFLYFHIHSEFSILKYYHSCYLVLGRVQKSFTLRIAGFAILIKVIWSSPSHL